MVTPNFINLTLNHASHQYLVPHTDHSVYVSTEVSIGHMKQTELYKRVARALVRRFYRDLKAVAAQEMKARHEGNPEPEPAGNDSLKQPHTSPYDNKYTSVRSRKSKKTRSVDHSRKKEVITADHS